MRAFINEHFRENFIEIYKTDPEVRLVTCIELLSPLNKRGAEARAGSSTFVTAIRFCSAVPTWWRSTCCVAGSVYPWSSRSRTARSTFWWAGGAGLRTAASGRFIATIPCQRFRFPSLIRIQTFRCRSGLSSSGVRALALRSTH